MKIRLSMQDINVCVDIEDARAKSLFRGMTKELMEAWGGAGKPIGYVKKVKLPSLGVILQDDKEHNRKLGEELLVSARKKKEMLSTSSDSKIEAGESDGKVLASDFSEHKKKYSGFPHITCSNCKKERYFCAKESISSYQCSCGSETKLEGMVKLFVNCECGNRAHYQTNTEEHALDIPCIKCGSLVAVKYNSKKRVYETIKS